MLSRTLTYTLALVLALPALAVSSTNVQTLDFSTYANGAAINGANNVVASNASGSAFSTTLTVGNTIGYAGSAIARGGNGCRQSLANSNELFYLNGINDSQNGEQQVSYLLWPGTATNAFNVSTYLRIKTYSATVVPQPDHFYRCRITNAGLAISKGNGGSSTGTSVATVTYTNPLTNNVWLYINCIATGINPTIIKFQVQRLDDSRWLFADGSWGPCQSPLNGICYIDTSSPYTGSSQAGMVVNDGVGSNISLDNFTFNGGITTPTLVAANVTNTQCGVQLGKWSGIYPLGGIAPYTFQFQSSPHGAATWTNLGGPVSVQTTGENVYQPPIPSQLVTGLTATTAYDFRVTMSDANGLLDTSAIKVVTTLANAPTDYYFSAAGLAGNNGLTSLTPKPNSYTIINGISYNPGDTIHLNGGDTFGDNTNGRTLRIPVAGVEGAPITITSYGTGRATLTCDDQWAVQVLDVGWHTYNNLNITARALSATGYYNPASPTQDRLVTGTIEVINNGTANQLGGINFTNITGSGGKIALDYIARGGRAAGAATITAGAITAVTLHQGMTGKGQYGTSGAGPAVTITDWTTGLAGNGSITTTTDASGNIVPNIVTPGTGYDTTGKVNISFAANANWAVATGVDNFVISNFVWSNCAGGIRINGSLPYSTDVPGNLNSRNAFTNFAILNCSITNAMAEYQSADGTVGSGIMIQNAFNGVVDHCFVTGCGNNNTQTAGPAGIWGTRIDLITFRNCGVENQLTSSGDGDSYDWDIGCTRCLADRCWSRYARGYGLLIFATTPGPGAPTNECVYRNCISLSDMWQNTARINSCNAAFGARNYYVNCTSIHQEGRGGQPVFQSQNNPMTMVNCIIVSANSSVDLFVQAVAGTEKYLRNTLFYDYGSPGRWNVLVGSTTYTNPTTFGTTYSTTVHTADPQLQTTLVGFPGPTFTGIMAAQNFFSSHDPASPTAYVIGKGVNPFTDLNSQNLAPPLSVIPYADFRGRVYPGYPANTSFDLGANGNPLPPLILGR
jgi:hypothetical protein